MKMIKIKVVILFACLLIIKASLIFLYFILFFGINSVSIIKPSFPTLVKFRQRYLRCIQQQKKKMVTFLLCDFKLAGSATANLRAIKNWRKAQPQTCVHVQLRPFFDRFDRQWTWFDRQV
jgi:hypothetical protein